MTIALPLTDYLYQQGSQDNGVEDGVIEDALKDVPFAVNLAGIDLVEDLHQDKRVEHNSVVFRGRSMEGGVPATVNVKDLLTCEKEGQRLLSRCRNQPNLSMFLHQIYICIYILH